MSEPWFKAPRIYSREELQAAAERYAEKGPTPIVVFGDAVKARVLDDLVGALAEGWWSFDEGGTWVQVDGDGNLSAENAAVLLTLVRKAQRAAGIEVRPQH